MSRLPLPLGESIAAAVALTLPAAAVMAALALAGMVGWGGALLAMAGTALLAGLLARPFLADFRAVLEHMRSLARDPDAPPAVVATPPARRLLAALDQMHRGWRGRVEALQSSLALNATAFDSLPDPILMLDRRRRVVRANSAARQLFGRDPAQRDLETMLRDPRLLEAADAVIAGQSAPPVEFALPVPVERHFRARVEPLRASTVDGSVAVLALHDLTASKRIERMRADFVANASHELRTPLSTLLGFIETLRGPARDDREAQERFLAIMHEQASRMARLVADLLSLSRIELEEHSQPTGRVDLRRILRGLADTLDQQARRRGMAIVLDLPDDLPPVIGEADELTQVFQNLLDNALKYGRHDTPVEVVARVGEPPRMAGRLPVGSVLVSVRDHGEGIAREHLPRLTERFFRVDDARSRKLGGTGLGLAIVKHIVNRHRGVLHVDSTLGDGSTFTVGLPPAVAPEGAADGR